MKLTLKPWMFVVGYIAVAFWTFGHTYNHPVSKIDDSPAARAFDALFFGTFWPVYLGCKIAIEVTK